MRSGSSRRPCRTSSGGWTKPPPTRRPSRSTSTRLPRRASRRTSTPSSARCRPHATRRSTRPRTSAARSRRPTRTPSRRSRSCGSGSRSASASSRASRRRTWPAPKSGRWRRPGSAAGGSGATTTSSTSRSRTSSSMRRRRTRSSATTASTSGRWTTSARYRPGKPDPAPTSVIPIPGCDVTMPVMGLGTWAWGDRSTWGMDGYDPSYGFDTIRDAYERAIAAGVTLLDTAEVYGNGESERIIGRLLREDTANRDRVVVATKFMPFPWRVPLARALMKSLRASLERLGLPFVHLYQIHGPISFRPPSTVAAALAAPYRAGLVKAVGVSNYSEGEMRAIHAALAAEGIPLATNQVEYSLLRTMPETSGLRRACRDLGVTLLAYSPLAMGRLTGKYGVANPPPGKRNFSAFPMAEIEPVVAELRRIGAAHGGKSAAQVALNWVMCKGAVPIPGAKNAAQAEQNAGALGWTLIPHEVAALDRVAKFGQRGLFNRVWQHG